MNNIKKQIFCILFFIIFYSIPLLGSSAEIKKEHPVQKELIVDIAQETLELHPHRALMQVEAQVLTAFYEGLFVYDPYNLTPLAGLAEKWKTSRDGLTWWFTIRENARFENGDAITAQTVKDSWVALLNPKLEHPFASLLDVVAGASDYRNGNNLDTSQIGLEVVSEYVLRVSLNKPAEHFMHMLCHFSLSVVHPDQFIHTNNTDDAPFVPISSGAFQYKNKTAHNLMLEKNPYYWDVDFVRLPSIRFILKSADGMSAAEFNNGEVDWITHTVDLSSIAGINTVHLTAMFATEYFFFQTGAGPAQDEKLRQALVLMLPYEKLREQYLVPATTLIFPLVGYPEINGIADQNKKKAAKILKDAKIDAEKIPPLVIRIPKGERQVKTAQIIADSWEEFGFTVIVESFSYEEYYDFLSKDDYAVGMNGWIGDFADPIAFLSLFQKNSGMNNSRWFDDSFEALIEKAGAEKDVETRYELFADAEQILLDSAVIMPLSHIPSLNIIDLKEVGGWFTNAIDIHPFKFIRFVIPEPLPDIAKLAGKRD